MGMLENTFGRANSSGERAIIQPQGEFFLTNPQPQGVRGQIRGFNHLPLTALPVFNHAVNAKVSGKIQQTQTPNITINHLTD